MAATKLRKEGENFIRSKCSGTGTSKLRGKATDKTPYKYNPDAVLPYCSPLTTKTYEWISNPDINGGVRTNGELGEALIKWYNQYAEEYSMDANIMAAQAYQESAYIVWNYAVNSSASGISQFVDDAVYDVIAKNGYGGFTNAERQAITKDMIGYTFTTGTPPQDPFLTDYELGRQNRAILHQNIIDNPKIMIKAQFAYMKFISTRCNKLASCTLFGYSRGPYLLNSNSSYSAWIAAAKSRGKSYEDEGIKYVYRIFDNLYKNFGYKHLDITKEAAANFDKFNATLG